jgi:hypothetical protein
LAHSEPYGFIIPRANKSNDYLIDWEGPQGETVKYSESNLQGIYITENEGTTPVLDRTKRTVQRRHDDLQSAADVVARRKGAPRIVA